MLFYKKHPKETGKEFKVMEATDLWKLVLNEVERKISKPSFETWFLSTAGKAFDGKTLVVSTNNDFQRDWLEGRFLNLIKGTLYEMLKKGIEVTFTIESNENTINSEQLNEQPILGRSQIILLKETIDTIQKQMLYLTDKITNLENEVKAMKLTQR
jgi:chromosomal replication initiation ATPase DnaA